MRCFQIDFKRYGWKVQCFVKVHKLNMEVIEDALMDIGCGGKDLKMAHDNLSSGAKNTGLCYSNPSIRRSVLVVSITTTPAEFMDSLVHEIGHWGVHLSSAMGIDIHSEEFCYALGDFARDVYPHVKDLLCCKCH